MFGDSTLSRWAWGALAVLAVALTYSIMLGAKARFSPDAYLYQRMLLEDRGVSPERALAVVRAYYDTQPGALSDPDAPGLYTADPPRWYVEQYPLFRARPLAPWLGSLVYPQLGFRALDWVAAAGIVVACGAIYVLLLGFAPPWLAALGALAASTTPLVRDIGTVATTDAPAYGFWALCLLASVWYARRASPGALAAAVLANVLLGLTRPAIWLAPAAALGLVVFAQRADRSRLRPALVLLGAQIAVGLGILAYTAAVHGAGFLELLRWQYDWHVARGQHWTQYGVGAWYALFVVRDLAVEALRLLREGAPLLGLAAAAIGLWPLRRDPRLAVFAGVVAIAPLAILVNPPDYGRALELPITPIVFAGVCALAAAALQRTKIAARRDSSSGGLSTSGPGA